MFINLPKTMTEGSGAGMIISIICTLAIVAVLFTEVSEFFSDKVTTVLKVQQHSIRDDTIKINLDISFPSAPCHILSLDVQDLMGTHIMNVGGHLEKRRFSSLGADLGIWNPKANDMQTTIEAAKQAFEQREGCALQGYISVKRVPGNFHISTHDYNQILAIIGK